MGRTLRHGVVLAGALLLFVWLGACAIACFAEPGLIFQPRPVRVEPKIHGGQLLRIPVAEGEAAVAVWVPAPPGACTVVHFHGNAEQLADVGWFAMSYERAGVGLLAVEYPGYGLAHGEPSERSIYRAADAAMAYLRDTLHVPQDRTVLEGWSLGTATATELALREEGSRLILIAPFTSIMDLGRMMFPILPVSLLVRDRFDTAGKAPRISMPTLIVHGTADHVIPVEMGEHLGTLFPHATTVIVSNADHDVAQHNETMDRIVAFARDCAGATSHPAITPPPE